MRRTRRTHQNIRPSRDIPCTHWKRSWDRFRFKGTCYRAANWMRLGATQGRTRDRNLSVSAYPRLSTGIVRIMTRQEAEAIDDVGKEHVVRLLLIMDARIHSLDRQVQGQSNHLAFRQYGPSFLRPVLEIAQALYEFLATGATFHLEVTFLCFPAVMREPQKGELLWFLATFPRIRSGKAPELYIASALPGLAGDFLLMNSPDREKLWASRQLTVREDTVEYGTEYREDRQSSRQSLRQSFCCDGEA